MTFLGIRVRCPLCKEPAEVWFDKHIREFRPCMHTHPNPADVVIGGIHTPQRRFIRDKDGKLREIPV